MLFPPLKTESGNIGLPDVLSLDFDRVILGGALYGRGGWSCTDLLVSPIHLPTSYIVNQRLGVKGKIVPPLPL